MVITEETIRDKQCRLITFGSERSEVLRDFARVLFTSPAGASRLSKYGGYRKSRRSEIAIHCRFFLYQIDHCAINFFFFARPSVQY